MNDSLQQRQAALEALTSARKTRDRAETERMKALQELADFMLKHRDELPTYAQDYLKHWELEKRQLDQIAEAASIASTKSAVSYVNLTTATARVAKAYNQDRSERHLKHFAELEANRVAPGSKLTQLLEKLNRGAVQARLLAADRSKK